VAVPVIAGRYVVQGNLGRGGGGDTYQVLDTHEQDVVALKLLTTPPPGGVWAEARILRRLTDSHILPIRNADLAQGQPYVVTELATHGSLDKLLQAAGLCGLGVDDVVRWTQQACHGVARSHDLRLLHNDLKPGNLFLNAQGEALVGDFGMAALLPPGATATPCPGATAETAAPEVAAAWKTPTPSASVQSDVFSLGATAFWLLAGRSPYDFGSTTDFDTKMQIAATQAIPRLRDLAPHVPQYVGNAIEKALAPVPSDRYLSVIEFATALGRRTGVTRRWRRTNEHATHFGCWRGEPLGTGNAYLLCLEIGSRPTQGIVTTTQAGSGRRINAGCRTIAMRVWGQGVRAAMHDVG
jgi:serine/threonine protein kinase